MSIPQDPVMLLSYVNTKLRDGYPSLDVFCERENAEKENIVHKLLALGYAYDEQKNQFI
ncbi:MAG: DUF4250 domain-containing protein [Clostridia bacterium]|nr:DUF4250 domain-containing protein [Clostridia bacterium]